jgi:hypothetical protein
MPVKPSEKEEEYFARQNLKEERRCQKKSTEHLQKRGRND